ncbi:hypothetical protein BW723_12500 [Polaribacter reichenbachii]|uniref:TonB-dependent receptor plug domain-containing protein n=1 Tax=Polaribacter reichenbachii TaxID=996801 RepID=A0A1B8U0A4_9FLAO|nr:hypothetical protein [Polaribacter reichenbachii]APZ47051.1 hypothetical protein BW723_12500 [Polaribacter reichenbachii]AUC17692.1 hypothetical protein BTO17_02950 [Polaribacter reichenbachii]OBY65285.1 hypothetical protein LPB301_09270 [Polaribacter reichenbachii]
MKKLVFLLILCVHFFSFGQNSTFTEVVKDKLDQFTNVDHQEKIFVHTDKSNYNIEDRIWFSAYLVDATNHLKSNKSKVVHAELINEKDSILDHKKFYMSEVSVAGDFSISEDVKPGKYLIRAYTNYMKNSGSASFFQKEIMIWSDKVNPLTISTENKEIIDNKPNLHFYPEGGYLVNDLSNFVAIKLKNSIFNEVKTPISIYDQDDNLVTTFSSSKFGLGMFNITPKKDETYFAKISFKDTDYTYPLPKALPVGNVLNAVINNDEIFINLKSNRNNGLFNTTLVIHKRGNILFNKQLKEQSKSKVLKLPIDKLDNGVLHITLFNSSNQPTCERLVFVNNKNNTVNVNIKKSRDYFTPRKKVSLNIDVNDFKDKNVESILSLTVKDMNTFPESTDAENIKTYLLLNSDVKGKIENPNYFFEEQENNQRKYLLDLIMRTNGWRRFTWQDLLFNQKLNRFDAEKGLFISGKTFSMKAPYKPQSLPTRLTFYSKVIEQEPIKNSDANGNFSYGPYVFYDSIPVLVESRLTNFKSQKKGDRKVLIVKNKEEKSPEIYRDTTASQNNKNNLDAYLKYQQYIKDIENAFKNQENMLSEVVIKSNLKTDKDIRRDEMNARTSYGNSFRRFDIENQIAISNNAFDIFYNIPGVNIVGDSIYINREPNKLPLFLYDEMPVDIIDLQNIDASNVSFVDVLIGADAAFFSNSGSVISIYSKLGNGNGNGLNSKVKRKPGIIDFNAIGFYTAKEFYAPDHINGIEESTKSDLRTTLHWEPQIKTTENNEVIIDFFTSDLKSNYLIEVQGITKTGIPIYGTSTIVVE